MKMNILLIAVAAMVAASIAATEEYQDTAADVLCQLNQGDVPLCPGASCREIYETRVTSSFRSGIHWLAGEGASAGQANCVETIPPSESTIWMQVANVNSNTTGCPAGLEEIVRDDQTLCRKTIDTGCSSAVFPTHGVSYSKVCGRVYGYINDTLDSFSRGSKKNICGPNCTIDDPYVDGVSITHGSPRQHVWTFGGGGGCPCSNRPSSTTVPPYVGEDYYCDNARRNTFVVEDRLWDGENCKSSVVLCCERANWFCKELPQPTTDDVEVRLCTDQRRVDEDIYVDVIEIYVQ